MNSDMTMKVLVTGAAGFIGQAVVAELFKRGHYMKVMLHREEQKKLFTSGNNLEVVVADVNDPASMTVAVQNIDVVIHLAGVVLGARAQMHGSMVDGTANLIEVMKHSGVKRLVLASSITVYDLEKLNGVLVETSPLLDMCDDRQGSYVLAKIQQESLARDLCSSYNIDLAVLRLGAVFTSDRIETADLGPNLAGLQFVVAPLRKLRLVLLTKVASSLVSACTLTLDSCLTINVIEDVQPTAWAFAKKAMNRNRSEVKVLIPLPYVMLRGIACLIYWLAKTVRQESKLPGLFIPQQIKNRFQSSQYDSTVWQKNFPSLYKV